MRLGTEGLLCVFSWEDLLAVGITFSAAECKLMRRRFFVERFEGRVAFLSGDAAHHLARVLRAEPGQLYELSDGQSLWLARIGRVGRNAVEFSLVEPLAARAARLELTLLLAIVKFDRFEWALEKATELGITQILPLAAARSEKGLVAAAAKRAARWQKILLEAAQQSRRLWPPTLLACARPRDAFSNAGAGARGPDSEAPIKLLLSERQNAPSLRAVLEGKSTRGAVVAIGPEGGWTDEELVAAHAAGFAEVSLGANILRTETAVTAALAILNYALGD